MNLQDTLDLGKDGRCGNLRELLVIENTISFREPLTERGCICLGHGSCRCGSAIQGYCKRTEDERLHVGGLVGTV